MSQKQLKLESPGLRSAKGGGGKKKDKNIHQKPIDSKFKENVVKKLYDSFQDSFDLELIASVAHTCQWDLGRSTEALMILGGSTTKGKTRNAKNNHEELSKKKTKSLPSTLKGHKVESSKGSSLYSSPNGLKSNPAHSSTNSLASGQVWQRHYKSKPQSPGLLTMIPPHMKEGGSLLKKTGSARSLPPMISAKSHKESPMVKKTSAAILRIQQLVEKGMKVMILMRGVPGAGKTHLAQVVVGLVTRNDLSQHIFGTDEYFIQLGRGSYAYDSNQLPQAHNWNQKRVSEALRRATNPVVVDNTHTQAWEMQPYVVMAVNHGYLLEVLEPVTPWYNKEAELAKRNVHCVPREKIRQMLDRYEPGWTGDKLLQLFDLKYQHCGVAHVPQEVTTFSNSPLAQHRQNAVIETPEKPKRKRNSPKRKDRRVLAGIEITEDREKQLEELNQLFAEYGKKMDPTSKKKVLESGVPISEVVSRMRKLQGSVLPLPKTFPATIPETPSEAYATNDVKTLSNFGRRESPSESLEPDTMSSSNVSESSEYETDSDAELAMMKNYIGYDCEGRFVDGEDAWEDEDEDEARAKSEGAAACKPCKFPNLVTSSQEELSLIDFEGSTPAGSSQEELSLIDFDGDDSPNAKGSSSSSEEQETQLLTLQESLKEVLINNFEKRMNLEKEEMNKAKEKAAEEKRMLHGGAVGGWDQAVEVSDAKTDGFSIISSGDTSNIVLNDSLIEMLMNKYVIPAEKAASLKSSGHPTQPAVSGFIQHEVAESKKSPDLEEIPLPLPPPESSQSPVVPAAIAKTVDKLDSIMKSWEFPEHQESKDYSAPKPARPKNSLLGAIKKTGIETDRSPEGLLKSADLSWSSVPFTSSWEEINKKSVQVVAQPVEKTDASTNTCHSDFSLWQGRGDGLVRLVAQNRNINENFTVKPQPLFLPQVLTLDKCCMVTEQEFEGEERQVALDSLVIMFPKVSKEYLCELLESSHNNVPWVVEVLLEGDGRQQASGGTVAQDHAISNSGEREVIPPNLEQLLSDGKKTIKRRKDRKAASSELSLMLKKQIEDSVRIGEDHYQDQTLFYKKLRHGEFNLDDPVPVPDPAVPTIDFNVGTEEVMTKTDAVEEESEDAENSLSMRMDPQFSEDLARRFGGVMTSRSQTLAELTQVINIPMSLAHQIYCCWIESMNSQLEDIEKQYQEMLKEDQVLAAALQEQEHDSKPPDLQEIMDMELAMALYKQEQTRENKEETMAAKLSKSILFDTYPNMDRNVLLDLFRSQGESLTQTLAVLSEQPAPKTVMSQEMLRAHEQQLLQQAQIESLKKEESARKPIVVVKEDRGMKEATSDVLVVNPAEFRQQMKLLHERRNDCCLHFKEAMSKRNYSVASYYSNLAALYKERIREAKKSSVNIQLFGEGDESPEIVSTTLDLHFLYVAEAVQFLDLFLDHHIAQLQKHPTANSCDLFLITGRGQRSYQGVSKIKPAVKRRLDQRKLNFIEDNPGMLKVVIHKYDLTSAQL